MHYEEDQNSTWKYDTLYFEMGDFQKMILNIYLQMYKNNHLLTLKKTNKVWNNAFQLLYI